MKLFINDWGGGTFVNDTQENKEYPVNKWLTLGDGKQIYLASLYVYDEFVMFFYIYAIDLMREYMEQEVCEIPKTNRDFIKQPRGSKTLNLFEYEVNHLKSGRGSSGGCLPTQTHYEEYDYLLGLMKERLPKELKGAALAFRKDCYAFEKPVDEIKNFAIFPSNCETRYYFIDKTLSVPFGSCDIKIEYPVGDASSYIILQGLKVYDMMEAFDEQYDDLREFYDKRLLILSYLVPAEHRTFDFYLKEYLDAEVDNGGLNQIWLYNADTSNSFDDSSKGGLHKRDVVLCEIDDSTKSEYEITLMWAVDSLEPERKAVFEMSFEANKGEENVPRI